MYLCIHVLNILWFNHLFIYFWCLILCFGFLRMLVLPKTTRGVTATAGAGEAWLPQWAVAVIVIGLASLLFVLVFGLTVVITDY